MIKHIVLWKIKDSSDGKSKQELMNKIKKDIEALKDHIPELLVAEVGFDLTKSQRSYDLALYSTFNSMDDLQVYQDHPDHVKVKDFIGPITETAAVVDFEI